MKSKIIRSLGVFVLAFAFLAGGALAADDNVSVPSGQDIGTDYINGGNTVDVAGNVNGDVILGGGSVSFSGKSAGDVLIAGGNARVSGDVTDDVRMAGGNLTLDGHIGRNVTIAGGSVILGEDSVVEGNLYVGGGNVELRGQVKGNVIVYASQIVFSGSIGGNAELRSSSILMRDDARVGGDLTYSSDNELSPKSGAVNGTVTRQPMQDPSQSDEYQEAQRSFNAGVVIWQFLSLLVMGFVFYKLFRRQANDLITPITRQELWQQIASGLLALIINPLIVLFVFITVVGAPLALLLLFAYVVFIVAASAISPVLVGRMFNGRFKFYQEKDQNLWVDFVFGFLLMQVVGMIPVIGFLLLSFLFLFSFGRVVRYVLGMIKRNRQ